MGSVRALSVALQGPSRKKKKTWNLTVLSSKADRAAVAVIEATPRRVLLAELRQWLAGREAYVQGEQRDERDGTT